MNPQLKELLQKPVVGSVLSVASGISFFFNLMLLPLVGRAGSSVPYADKNQMAFLSALGLTFALSALATWSKVLRRSGDKSPLPIWSMGLCAVCVILFVLLMTGRLAV
ncbi:MAG: hypothetical protein IT583_02490 [Verrucomicrobia bacterium]|nr:hypothetical protein [Verrucomicrobiota bacterium]